MNGSGSFRGEGTSGEHEQKDRRPNEAARRRLETVLEEMSSCIVAYSGGVDSTLLAVLAHKKLGVRMRAVFARSPFMSAEAVDNALSVAERCGLPLEMVDHAGFAADTSLRHNPEDRCYRCKYALFEQLTNSACASGYAVVVHGENLDDGKAYRPGARATRELGARAPFVEAGFDKKEIRAWARALRLPNADRPSDSCLATRFPYGATLSDERLQRVAKTEQKLHERFGLRVFRVRSEDERARIEVAPDELGALLEDDTLCEQIRSTALACGFSDAKLDLHGYRSGSYD